MSLENCWVRGICWKEGVSSRGFGEVYKALDKGSGMYVAVKITRLLKSDKEWQSESELLMSCNSPFIVRYNGVISDEKELWVLFGRRGWWNRLLWSSAIVDHLQHASAMEITSRRMNCVRLRVAVCLDCITCISITSCTEWVIGMMNDGIGHQTSQSVPFREWCDQIGWFRIGSTIRTFLL